MKYRIRVETNIHGFSKYYPEYNEGSEWEPCMTMVYEGSGMHSRKVLQFKCEDEARKFVLGRKQKSTEIKKITYIDLES